MLRDIGENRPVVIICLGVCAGILIYSRQMQGLFACLAIIGLACPLKRIPHVIAGICIGIAAFMITPKWIDIDSGEHLLEGTVVDEGFSRGVYRVLLDGVRLDSANKRGLARLSIYKHVQGLDKGDRIRCQVTIRPLKKYGNKSDFDSRTYFLSQCITMRGFVKDFNSIGISRHKPVNGLKKKVSRMLDSMSRPEAEVLKAVLLGDRSGIGTTIRDSFAALGLSHLMAISGLHIGIVMLLGYTMIFFIIRAVPALALRCDGPMVSKIAGIACALSYTAFVGPSIPTLRASIMAVSLIGSFLFLRKPDLLEGLAIAGIIILAIWPFSLFSISFALSFAAVLGIAGVYNRFFGYPRSFQLLALTIAATVFTLPVVVYAFGFVSYAGIVSNLVFVPAFSMAIMPVAITGLLVFPLSETMAGYLFSLAMDGIGSVFFASDIIGALKPAPKPWIVWVYITYTALITAFFARQTRLRGYVLIGLCFLIVLIPVITHNIRQSPFLKFDFISVGHGDCTLVTKGPVAVLIDAGGSYSGYDTGRYIVGPHLLSRGITRLDLVVITHSHPDHIGGMPFIIDRFDVAEVWTNVREDWSPYFNDVIQVTKEKSIMVRNVCLGDESTIGGIGIEVLHPQKRIEKRKEKMDLNLHSVVTRIGDETMTGMFTGDADGAGEITLAHLGRVISADVLKVSHHGSRRSCSNVFLKGVRPSIAVISCGSGNIFNNPSKEALFRLEALKAAVYRTDLHGEVVVYKADEGLDVKYYGHLADN